MAQENVEMLRRVFALISSGDVQAALDAAEAIAHPDIEVRAVGRLPDQEPVRGREAGRAWLANLLQSEVVDFEPEPEEFIDVGDAVVVPTKQAALGMGSGARVTNRLVYVYGFRGGKVVYFDAFDTKEKALEAVGLSD
jgi:ketosteroid isomerase-like protein